MRNGFEVLLDGSPAERWGGFVIEVIKKADTAQERFSLTLLYTIRPPT